MYPSLQNGDLVVYTSFAGSTIPNGTIVVYVVSGSGSNLLDSLTRPVVIHRVVAEVTQPDGSVVYRTKGDNNQQVDPALVPLDHVLGTPVGIIPKAGILLLFAGSTQGEVAIVAAIALLYLGSYETKAKEQERKDAFLGAVAMDVISGRIPEPVFNKLELATKHVGSLVPEQVNDSLVISFVDWAKRGGLRSRWVKKEISCEKCGSPATAFETDDKKGLLLTVCGRCSMHQPDIEEKGKV